MSLRRKLSLTLTGVGIVVLAAVILALAGVFAASAAPSDADAPPPVTVNVKASTEGTINIYDVSVVNNATKSIAGMEIRAAIPQGGKFVFASPASYKFDGSAVIWDGVTGLDPGKTAAGYQFKVDGGSGSPVVSVNYWGNLSGSATTQPATQAQTTVPTPTPTVAPPNRGCLACHTGTHDLGEEAESRAKADYGADHPTIAPSGASIKPGSNASVAACLECHKPSKANPGKGAGAPITLRDIVHPAHMSSTTFVGHYNGNCFTCHDVTGTGEFYLLGDKVDVNDKGVPKALLSGQGAIPGWIAPSEDNP